MTICLALALSAGCSEEERPGGGGGSGGGSPSGQTCLQGSGDYTGNGPYRVAKKNVTIGNKGQYTLFYPNPLDSNCPHPVVAWGNGTFVTGSDVYGFYQEHAASWGIVVAVSHNSNVGDGSFHKAAIDYLLAENKSPSSIFYNKLSDRAGTSGHSQGGAGADRAANHPNVEAVVNVQGNRGTPPAGVALLCLTGTADIMPAGCPAAARAAREPAMSAKWNGGDHISTATLLGYSLGDKGTRQYMRLYSAWFRCFLADDQNACAMFKGGQNCPVCREAGWTEIFSNNF